MPRTMHCDCLIDFGFPHQGFQVPVCDLVTSHPKDPLIEKTRLRQEVQRSLIRRAVRHGIRVEPCARQNNPSRTGRDPEFKYSTPSGLGVVEGFPDPWVSPTVIQIRSLRDRAKT
jgi:hypothetical protein